MPVIARDLLLLFLQLKHHVVDEKQTQPLRGWSQAEVLPLKKRRTFTPWARAQGKTAHQQLIIFIYEFRNVTTLDNSVWNIKYVTLLERENFQRRCRKGLKLDVKEHKMKPARQNANWAQQHILHNLQLRIPTQYNWNHREGKTNEELDSLPKCTAEIPLKHFNTHEKLFLLA